MSRTAELRWPWRATLPFAFVVLSLALLVLVPVLVDRRTAQLRTEREAATEPARELIDRVEAAIAHGVAARRGFLLTGDTQFLARYRDALGREAEAQAALWPLVQRLGDTVRARMHRLATTSAYWHGTEADLLERLSRQQGTQRVVPQQVLYESTLAAAEHLREAVVAVQLDQRRRIARLDRVKSAATITLVLLAFGAVVVLARVGRRAYRQARSERELRDLAEALAGATAVDEVGGHVTGAAVGMTGAAGAYVELLVRDGGHVEVVAAAGACRDVAGTRVPRPGSSAERTDASGTAPAVAVLELPEPIAQRLAASMPTARALSVPLSSEDQWLGTLVVVTARGRGLGKTPTARLALLQDIACLGLRRALLLEEAQQRSREAEHLLEVKERLIRGISHDLKNPLGAADAYAELMESGVGGELTQQQRDYLGRLRRAGRAMRGIIEDLLRYSQADTSELELRRERIDPGHLAREIAEDYRAAAEAAGLTLDVQVEDELPSIRTDSRRVSEIIANVLTNAVKYTPSGGRILVSVSTREARAGGPSMRMVAVEVADTGPGIPAAQRERIFEEFSRLQPARASGAGIGLSISRRIARLLGGDLTLRARDGGGSVFTVLLPVREPAPPAPIERQRVGHG